MQRSEGVFARRSIAGLIIYGVGVTYNRASCGFLDQIGRKFNTGRRVGLVYE